MRKLWFLVLLLVLSGCERADDGGRVGGAPEAGAQEAMAEETLPESGDSLSLHDSTVAADSGRFEAPGDSVETVEENSAPRISDFHRPEYVRGIYLNAWAAGSRRRQEALIDLARRTEVNSFVIDIKDATGYISHPTSLPLAREVGATGEVRIRDLAGLLGRLKAADIYPIARIVVAKDPLLTGGRPDLAIQDSTGGLWFDQDSVNWLNLHHRGVWDYHVELAREVVRAGFPEVQWDYVRFPDAPEALRARAVFPESEGRPRVEAVRSFLKYSREILGEEGAEVTADVFGVTTSYRRDVGIGQLWESFIGQVDVALPMVYPSHYWPGSFGFQKPNEYPYEVVRRALRDAVSRSATVEGAGNTRPWLQDFSLGDPPYGAPEVRAQIQATYDAGIHEWILWNPGSSYTESALLPKGSLPSWLEPVMRVGGVVVPLSKRFEVLGEDPPEGVAQGGDTIELPDLAGAGQVEVGGVRTLPAVPIPDTVGATSPDTVGATPPDTVGATPPDTVGATPPDTGRAGRSGS